MDAPPLRPLGRSGLRVSPIVLGGNVFGWTADEPTSFSLLDAWLDQGFNTIDTADVYSRWVDGHQGGESEAVIGRWLARRGRREDVIIATKVGMDMGGADKGLSKAWILRAADRSLQRLGTDYIDLYQSHTDDADTPLEETLEAYARLIEAGKVRAIGASNHSAARLRQALEVSARDGLPRYESLQPLYNVCDRRVFEEELAPLCVEEDIGVINFYALAAGFLTGKYRSEADLEGSARAYRVKDYLNERGLRILAALDAAAEGMGATPAEVALAWQLARPGITAPIASATSLAQLESLARASRLQLDAETTATIDAASA